MADKVAGLPVEDPTARVAQLVPPPRGPPPTIQLPTNVRDTMPNASNPTLPEDPPRSPSPGDSSHHGIIGDHDETVIRPPGFFSSIDLVELLRYRGVLGRKVKQRILVEYDRMWLGFLWAVARPLLMVLVFWTIRGLAEAKTGVLISYPLYVYTGLVCWFYFTAAVSAVALSLQRDAGQIQKVYFPRLISPLSHLFAETYNLTMAALPLVILMAVFGEYPDARLLLLPVVILQIMLLALGVGLIFCSLVLISRDWERFLKLCLYVGFWTSPVIYSLDMIPADFKFVYLANPMGGSLLAVRASLFAGFEFDWGSWFYSVGFTGLVLVIGLLSFQRTERTLADRI